MALGEVKAADIDAHVAVDRTFTPDPANRAVYDRLFAELPGLYKAQKKMFSRLNG
jgi:xylulokinase